jgi:two-component system sensor histidine kinase AlgZ
LPAATPRSPSADTLTEGAATGDRRAPGTFLPDFCGARAVFAVVLLAELVAVMLALARHEPGARFFDSLARISLFLQWTTLLSAGALCLARRPLAGHPPGRVAATALVLVLACVALVSVAAWSAARAWDGLPAMLSPPTAGALSGFVARNCVVAAIVTGLLLRYFWVTAQWREHVQAEAR